MALAPLLPVFALTVGGRAVGQPVGHWIAQPDEHDTDHNFPTSERRTGLVSVGAALTTYYGAALGFLLLHYRWTQGWGLVEPYLRLHLFDGFGCAALFALIFHHVRRVNDSPQQGGGLARWLRSEFNKDFLWAAAWLTAASAAIAAASVFVAGAALWDMLWAGLAAALILIGFWSGVVAGVAFAMQAKQNAKQVENSAAPTEEGT